MRQNATQKCLGQRQRQVNNFISWKQQQNQHFYPPPRGVFAEGGTDWLAASAWHCQLKLTVKQTTQQGHLSCDQFPKKEKCRFSAYFSLCAGVGLRVFHKLINHLLCVSFIFPPMFLPSTVCFCFLWGNQSRKSFSKDQILFATCFHTQHS